MKTSHPVTRAALGITALIAIAILANWLVALTPLGNRGIDFTENQIHTLSDGTRAILEELDTPVTIRYYASRGTDYMPEDLKLHMRRVDGLLKEYAALSDGRLRVEYLDPEPDTDAEDSANLDGISGQRIDDQNLYFGLAISCLDQTRVIPFLDPRDETMLEYHLSKRIAEVSAPTKPMIGVMSAFELAGGAPQIPGQPPQQPWVIYQQLDQSFELKDVPLDTPSIDPKAVNVLLVFHPAGITPEAEYAIDQYLLGGGTVVACLDAHSVAAQMLDGGNSMMGMGGVPTSSNLPHLLKTWGVEFESGRVLADPAAATQLGGGRRGLAVLTMSQAQMPQEDSVITKDLGSMTFFLPGAISLTGADGVSATTLVASSKRAGFVDSYRAAQLDPALDRSLQPEGKAFDLVTHLQGIFTTSFPEGEPSVDEAEEDEAPAEADEQPVAVDSLRKSTAPGNVFLIADVDMFYDHFAYTVQDFGGMQMASPANGNATLLLNVLDQAVGSRHLIGSRSRSATRRPFTVVQEMEADFNRQVGAKVEEFEQKRNEAQQRLNELQVQRTSGNDLYLSPEQETEIQKLREQQVDYARLIREQEKELRRQKNQLAGRITLLNVVLMPVIVIFIGLILLLKRRRATRAR